MEPKPPSGVENALEKRGRGRPTKLSPQIQAKICEILRSAGTVEQACASVGVDPSSYQHWKAKGLAQPRGKYRDFFQAVQKAMQERLLALESRIVIATRDHMAGQDPKTGKGGHFVEGDWRAALALLERLKPRQWAPRVYQHVDKELDDALDRLEREFKDEPALLERALNAIAGGQGGATLGGEEDGEHRANPGGGEAVQPPPTEPQATPGPRA